MVKCFKIIIIFFIIFHFISSNQIPTPKLLENGLMTRDIIEECISLHKVDVMLLLETSEFIDKYTFDIIKFFSINLMNRFNISENGNHFGFITYSNNTIDVNPFQWNTLKIRQSLEEIKFTGHGKPLLGKTLEVVKETIFSPFTFRESVPKVLFIITTGQSYDDITYSVEDLQRENILIYSIGITEDTNLNNLYILSNNPSRIFHLTIPLDMIDNFIDSIIWDACKTSYRVGVPEIICGKKSIGIRASTKKDFEGYIYVMDHFNRKECRKSVEQLRDLKSLSLTIPFNRCNVKRWRNINPRGIHIEVTIIIQYHHLFMTGVDQVIKAKCFYQEGAGNVEFLSKDIKKSSQLPICTYNLHKDTPNGEIIHVANIGEKVWHVWECKGNQDNNMYGMLVHNCYVDNGRGDVVQIIDNDGCSLDSTILDTPIYNKNWLTAVREGEVFKFADKPALQFQCKITLCNKKNGGCDKIVPPKCDKKKLVVKKSKRETSNTLDVATQQLEVTTMKNNSNTCIIQTVKISKVEFLMFLNIILLVILIIFCFYWSHKNTTS
ncbi:Zona pellucida domain and von Willebrand factor, type A domain-containing protein [Strongyloides ratti]|uniref:Zona pellucida domain and von Willebrand factor, type A domain-containing protein n=1 Tax=Strongyloides ratti TaxID=34506 RepID=A0A090MZ04_STRRB|nr:Zona pellucida domain and von Willebrand factor, type A domain-containing protein [Strongyloides ratti]CEF68089.1 Zona pellucida domain and von Willebrand factor, type A domain-containing protein [Strongyloides ratti]